MAVGSALVGFVFVGTGVGLLALLREPIRHPEKPGSKWFGLTVVGIALWPLSLGISYLVGDYGLTVAAWNGRAIAATIISVSWFTVALEYTTGRRPPRLFLVLASAYLVTDVLVTWSNPIHGLVLTDATALSGTVLLPDYGLWFWARTVVNYAFIVMATALLAVEWSRTSGIKRRQAAVLTVAVVPPIIANVATLFEVFQSVYDVTPFGLAGSGLLLSWALYRVEFLDVVPVARETVVEEMRDAVITIDADGRVVDANATARDLLDLPGSETAVPAEDVFRPVDADVVSRLEDGSDVDTRVTAHVDGRRRHFSLSISPVGTDGEAGQVVVLRDVTPIIRRERALEEREGELDLLRQVLTRVLTHNVRNALTTIHGNAELLVESVDGSERERVDTIVDASDDLLEISEKVRHVERILTDEEPIIHDLGRIVEAEVADLREEYPEVDFEVDVPETCEIQSSPGLDAAVEALLENAAEYNDPEDPRVTVTVDPDGPTLSVRDQGPGIPPGEVDVLEAERETALRHGSGIGLWLVKWVADHSGADLSFSRAPSGTTATLTFGVDDPDHVELVG